MAEKNNRSLEEDFEALQEIVGRMESEEMSLEETFTAYSKGMELLKKCSEQVDQVEKKVQALRADGTTVPFEDAEGEE
ncbi:MAG: exodeoxyribonuclease VII small subunit [Lachnospiraceae bacterium]|jgi:exodeoxyribonuclease VII small subunit|nr:exodeoxyribonuclease VII small subunit [Lachnospiraceae bacterium]